MLTDKESLLSSDGRHRGWIIYGGIPTHWLRKRHTPTEGTAMGKSSVCAGCVCVSVWVYVSVVSACTLSSQSMYVWISPFFLSLMCFFSPLSKLGCYWGHNTTLHLTGGSGSKWKRLGKYKLMDCPYYSFSLCWVALSQEHCQLPIKKCWTPVHAIINTGAWLKHDDEKCYDWHIIVLARLWVGFCSMFFIILC